MGGWGQEPRFQGDKFLGTEANELDTSRTSFLGWLMGGKSLMK